MFKRLLFIGLLSVSLIALVSTEAPAACRLYRGYLFCGSVCADTFLRGVGASDINTTEVCVSLGLQEVILFCMNNGGNSEEAEGKPFFPNVIITAGELVTPADIIDVHKGTGVKDICFKDSEIFAAIPPGNLPNPLDYCPNRNWSFDTNRVRVEKTYVYYSTYAPDKLGILSLTSELCQLCTFDETAAECSYNCSQVSSMDPNFSNCVALKNSCAGAVP